MPIHVRLAHVVLAMVGLFIVGTLVYGAWQEPEIRVLMFIYGVAGASFWSGITLTEWYNKRTNL